MLTTRTIAPTTFIAAPDAKLAAPDVYEIQSDAVINNTPSIDPDKVTSDLLGNMKGGSAMAAGLPGLESLTTVDAKGNFISSNANGATLSSGTLGSSSVDGGYFTSISNGLKSVQTGTQSLLGSLQSGIASIPGMNANNMSALSSLLTQKGVPASLTALVTKPLGSSLGSVATINGVSSNVPTSSLSDFSSVAKLINTAVGSSSTVSLANKDATARLISALTIGGAASGVNNAFSSTLPLAGGDKSIISVAAVTSLLSAAKTGNVAVMANIATSAGASAIGSIGKSAMSLLSTNYSLTGQSGSYSAAAQRQAFSDTQTTLSTINPNWLNNDRYKIDATTKQPVLDFPVIDASLVKSGSPAFAGMMCSGAVASDDPDMKYLAMVSAFPQSTPEAELAKAFPLTVTGVTTRTSANTDIVLPPGPELVPGTPEYQTQMFTYLKANSTLQ